MAEELSNKKHYFYFDEIQNIGDLEKFAIRIANQGFKVDITGSNAKMLSKEIAAKLGGRYLVKEIYPYSFKEFLKAMNINEQNKSFKNIASINSLLESYFINGGFPESLNFINKRDYLSNIYQKVLYNDIIVHNEVRNEFGIKLMIKKIAESLKQDLYYTKIQNIIIGTSYKISKDVIIDYSMYCKDAYLIFSIFNYYASFIDKVSNPKYYFMDNGILNLFIDDKRSSLLENIVAIHLYKNHKDYLYYLKGQKVDIDFYLSDLNIAIQVAYSLLDYEAYQREIENLIQLYKNNNDNNLKLLIITYDEDKEIEISDIKIKIISLKNFLLNFN